MQKPEVNWRKVWRVMHDLQYKRLDLTSAIALAKDAGHPAAAKLAMDTLMNGYALTREIKQ